MKAYIGNTPKRGTHIVVAELMSDGDEYRVVYAESESRLLPATIFEETYHELTWHERQLLEQTDAEHQVSAISDGDANEHECIPEYDETVDETYCQICMKRMPNEPKTRILETPAEVDAWNKAHPANHMKLGDTVRIRK